MRKNFVLASLLLGSALPGHGWGFYAHRQINTLAVFLLPPELVRFYKPHIQYLGEHAVDPDKRRYAVAAEGPRHFIDIDHYGHPPYPDLPRNWKLAVEQYGTDTLQHYGIVPWWVQTMLGRLTEAFREKQTARILKLSAEIGHYIGDAHVPLHASGNHDGQLTGQKGIHGFWESRIPELLAEREWDFFIGSSTYIKDPAAFIWDRILESAAAADTVLRCERHLNAQYPPDRKYAFEERNGVLTKSYSSAYTQAYNGLLRGMVERRMRQSVYAVASFWYTAWVDAGQPDLHPTDPLLLSEPELTAVKHLDSAWRRGKIAGRSCE